MDDCTAKQILKGDKQVCLSAAYISWFIPLIHFDRSCPSFLHVLNDNIQRIYKFDAVVYNLGATGIRTLVTTFGSVVGHYHWTNFPQHWNFVEEYT